MTPTIDKALTTNSFRPFFLYFLPRGSHSLSRSRAAPGVRGGIEQDIHAEAEQEIVGVSKALQEDAAILDDAAGIVQSLNSTVPMKG